VILDCLFTTFLIYIASVVWFDFPTAALLWGWSL
jgi:hypothetical protein